MIPVQDIERIFREADIEGLIENGAPDNEYDSEAREVATALSQLSADEMRDENITAIIALVWARSFNRGEDEIEVRLPAFRNVAQKILE